jgi:streptogramin lyase
MRYSSICLPLVALLPLVLTGCSLSTTANSTADPGVALSGVVRGGQQSIVGAHVYLFAAGTTGYGGAGIAATSSNASVSLLTSGPGRTLDTSGGATNGDYYVTTGTGGAFSITGDYSCTANTQVYLYSLGGDAGSGTNSAAGLVAALGNCPSGGSFATQTPNLILNEVTTIAAAYGFAGFASDSTHVSSSGTAAAQLGIANAFANAANVANIVSGGALATTPGGNGTVPQSEVNTLANVLASCVNTTGPGSSACSTLFVNAKSAGPSGTTPTETATAAINMAHNPAANVAALYALSIPTPPFAPALSAQPANFTVALNFTGGGLNGVWGVAVDGLGDVWATNNTGNSVTELASTGSPLSGASGYTGGGLNTPNGIAMDGSGNAWIANNGGSSIVKLSSSGSILSGSSGFTGGGIGNAWAVVVDGSGNAWTVNFGGGNNVTELAGSGSVLLDVNASTSTFGGLYALAIDGSSNVWLANHLPSTSSGNDVTKISSSGTVLSGTSGYTGGGLNIPHAIAIDSGGNAWVANFSGASVSEFSSSGAPLSGTGGYAGGGVSNPQGIAIDGAGNVWVANNGNGNVVELSNTGTFLSGTSGYATIGTNLESVAVDGSGNVWVSTYTGIAEFVGAGAPVVTPLATGVKNNTLGTRP